MARIDDFKAAREQAVASLMQQHPATIAQRSGFVFTAEQQFQIPFLGRTFHLSYPDFHFIAADAQTHPPAELPLQEQVLLLHYLLAEGPPTATEWIAYRDIPGASFYHDVFVKRATAPLQQMFAANLPTFQRVATQLGGQACDTGDACYIFQVLPRLALQFIIWQADDDFAAEASILFSANAKVLLLPEDAAWLASLLVYRLMGLARVKG